MRLVQAGTPWLGLLNSVKRCVEAAANFQFKKNIWTEKENIENNTHVFLCSEFTLRIHFVAVD